MSKLAETSTERESDAELVVAVARGDLHGLGELFDRHAPELRRFLARMGLPWADIDDLIQHTMLELVRAAPRFDDRYSARAWLFGIAIQLVRRHRRSIARTAARIVTWAGFLKGEAARTPAEICEVDEQARRLQQALDRLSPKKREVFVLVTLEGMSGHEAAAVLGIPVNTVWTRLHHARLALRAALEEQAP